MKGDRTCCPRCQSIDYYATAVVMEKGLPIFMKVRCRDCKSRWRIL